MYEHYYRVGDRKMSEESVRCVPALVHTIRKTFNVELDVANKMIHKMGVELDLFCQEEGFKPLNSFEKTKLILGMFQAIQKLAKEISNRIT
ncbi:unnamed protein product [marine sediment metagenome]|uniref:Uncharacterized protein n=1 Tax=marine sediment metagenome TaxID=412755 RepID=X1EEB0_9ZZZZ